MGFFYKASAAASGTSNVRQFAGVSFDVTNATLIDDSNLLMFLAPTKQFPGIEDLKGLVTDADVSPPDANTFASESDQRERLPDSSGNIVTSGISKSALQVSGALTLRSLVAFREAASSIRMIGIGASGESSATNFLYLVTISAGSFQYDAEKNSGSNLTAAWRIPGRLPIVQDKPVLLSLFRTASGDVTCYAWQYKLGDITSLTGMTDAGSGVASGGTPNGGSSGTLEFFSGSEPAVCFHAVYSDDDSANQSTFCDGVLTDGNMPEDLEKLLLPADSVLSTLATESNTVSLFVSNSAKSSGYEDLKAYIDGDSAASNASAKAYIGSSEFTKGDARFTTSSKTDLQITGEMTLRALVMFNGTGNRSIVAHGTSGETPGSNYIYLMWFGSTTTIRTFWESGSGSNHEAFFTVPAAYSPIATSQAVLISLVRVDAGSGDCDIYCYVNGVQCTVSSVSGLTNNTTHATGNFPSGGGSGSLYLGNDPAASGGQQIVKFIQVIDAATSHATREPEVAALFGFS